MKFTLSQKRLAEKLAKLEVEKRIDVEELAAQLALEAAKKKK